MRHICTLALLAAPLAAIAAEPVTPPDAPVVVYQTDDAYDDVKSNLEIAITGRGLVISTTLHISDMYQRTAKDIGLERQLYEKAESLEFCSIPLAYQMSSAHPANLAVCPLTIGLYTTPEAPEQVNVTYRLPALLGDGAAATTAVREMLDGIVQEALE